MTNVLALQELAEDTRLEGLSTISFIGCDT